MFTKILKSPGFGKINAVEFLECPTVVFFLECPTVFFFLKCPTVFFFLGMSYGGAEWGGLGTEFSRGRVEMTFGLAEK